MPTWDPADYHHHSEAQRSWARELVSKLRLTGAERVLDVGCGDGKVTVEIAARVPRGTVVGIDSSEEMIRFAREAFPPDRCPGVRFAAKDARRLDFEGEFDVVFSNATLHWIVDHRPVLDGIHRALVPGGRALLQMGGRGNAASILEVLDLMSAQTDWRPFLGGFACPYGFHAPDTYRVWAEGVGLHPLRLELIPKDMTQAGPEGLAAWIRTTWLPYLERIPEPRRSDFAGELVSRYLERHPLDTEGRTHVAMVRLEAELARPA